LFSFPFPVLFLSSSLCPCVFLPLCFCLYPKLSKSLRVTVLTITIDCGVICNRNFPRLLSPSR
jgi:hypothetical protein